MCYYLKITGQFIHVPTVIKEYITSLFKMLTTTYSKTEKNNNLHLFVIQKCSMSF